MKTVTDINKRWESGVEHHPKSQALFTFVREADFVWNGDSLDLKAGGDGDNGESLMYLMDVYFDAEDNGELEEVKAKLASDGRKGRKK